MVARLRELRLDDKELLRQLFECFGGGVVHFTGDILDNGQKHPGQGSHFPNMEHTQLSRGWNKKLTGQI